MPRDFRSDAMEAIHETVVDLLDAGLVDKKTMKEFDHACLIGFKEHFKEDAVTRGSGNENTARHDQE